MCQHKNGVITLSATLLTLCNRGAMKICKLCKGRNASKKVGNHWTTVCDSRLLLAIKSLYSCFEVCVRVGRVKSRPFTVGVGLRQGCVLSLLLVIVYIRGGQITARGPHRPTDQFNPTCCIPCTFFSSATFQTVGSSATALTAACHVNRTVSGPPVARQSRIRPSGQNV